MEHRPEGRIATFYSYKGGTGRSMALANFAWILAANGRKVLAIDWDLEAPGLHRYFRPFLTDPDLFETDGIIDTIWSFAASAMAKPPSGELSPSDQIGEAIEDARRRLDWKFTTGGYIDFVGAGRQSTTYSERVNTLDWKRFYDLGGARMLTVAKARLRAHYDWVLIDSRTGVSDTAGICTMQLPDTVVACFTLNRQSIDGVAAVLRSIRAFRSGSIDGSRIGLFPLATRIENAEQGRLEVARNYARTSLQNFLPMNAQSSARGYWDQMELGYRPAYAFEEVLAAFGDATGVAGASDTMLSQTEAMSQRIAGDQRLRMPEIIEADRERVLAAYAFGPRQLATKKTGGEPEHDFADIEFLRGVRAKEELWRRSNFRWQRLLSRRELDLLTSRDRSEFGRNMQYYLLNSERAQVLFSLTDLAFAFVWPLVLFIWMYSFWSLGSFGSVRPTESQIIRIYLIFVGAWPLLSLLYSAFILSLRERPYGLEFGDVLRLVLLSPFRRKTHDYEPSDEHSPSR
jgi:hypothetical protein